MKSQERFVALSSLPTYFEMDDKDTISWNMDLPQTVDTERLVLDVHRFQRFQKIAAFRNSHIYGYDGETTVCEPSILGVNGIGTAVAARKATLKKAKITRQTKQDTLPQSVMRQSGKIDTYHELNRSEIVSRVVDAKRNGASTENAWADQLNATLGSSIRASAKEHLINRIHPVEKMLAAGIGGSGTAVVAGEIAAHDVAAVAHYLTIIGIVALSGNLLDMRAKERKHGQNFMSERRWSVSPFPGMQFDRYAAVSGLSRVLPLISAQK